MAPQRCDMPFELDPSAAIGVFVVAALLVAGASLLTRRFAQHRASLDAARRRFDRLRMQDPVTGLATRAEFEAALEAAVLDADHADSRLALLYVGLDGFRAINDGYGHAAGDAVLADAARRLAGLPLPLRAASRVGGDEFALLFAADKPAAARAAADALNVLRAPFAVAGTELRLSASAGLAMYPDHGSRLRLLAHAALAMRAVKHHGGAGHAWFDAAMAVDQRERAELVQALRHAVERRELTLVYQPKVDAATLEITAVEALLRWEHPQRGMISPAVFVPLAERHGLIGDIGDWVIGEACRQAAEWRGHGLRMRVAVNLSGHQLRRDDLVDHIQATLRRHAIPPERLTCEITETVAMEDTQQTRRAFERLRAAGLHVSIDDFGTGYSSLAALRRLPAAELKVDRAFVTDLDGSERARSIVRAVVGMAHSLGLRVVAEGVETEAQRDALVALGCDEMQGYLFAKPMSATALALWADDGRADAGAAPPPFRASLFDPTAPAEL